MTLPASGPLAFTDIQTEFGGSNPIGLNEYYAGGGLVPAGTSGTYGAVPSSGQISVQNFYGTTAFTPIYIEEVFSTYLYKGTDAALTITNGIDLSTKGGLVWIKNRQQAGYYHVLTDTARGANKQLYSNTTDAQATTSLDVTSFTTTGFTLGGDNFCNQNNALNVSWTFREQPKFFDIVTYSGSNSTQTISHNLGSAPGCIIIKKLDSNTFNAGWAVYHRSLTNPNNYYLVLNTDAAETNYGGAFISSVSSTTFTVAGGAGSISLAGSTYIAYLFAHNAGGFGAAGTDNVISCGSYTTDGSGQATVNLGYEPQLVLFKASSTTSDWLILDNMRGFTTDGASGCKGLKANTSGAETNNSGPNIRSTGFFDDYQFGANTTVIYIAIRRGPMKVPTDATKVFIPIAATNASTTVNTTNFPVDMQILTSPLGDNRSVVDRLRSVSTNSTAVAYALKTEDTVSENTTNLRSLAWNSTSFQTIAYFNNYSALYWNFRRAPSFFDEVCYTGTGSSQNVTHNLTVAPELVLIKSRSNGGSGYGWVVGSSTLPSWGRYLQLNTTDAVNGSNNAGPFNNTAPTSSVFTVNTWSETNNSGSTYVAYLFATCAGVSKVGSFTGNGTTQTINCSFTTGARFVLIKRTDDTGGWYTYDTARGMTTVTDPYLFLNTQGAQTATLGSVTTVSTGFALNAAILAAINTNGASYIFLAIA